MVGDEEISLRVVGSDSRLLQSDTKGWDNFQGRSLCAQPMAERGTRKIGSHKPRKV